MAVTVKRAWLLICLPPIATGLAACGKATSTAGFKGEQHAVAQAIASLQADATATDERRICSQDLASALVARLNAAREGCQQALKSQLAAVDNFELSVQSVTLVGAQTASARVSSVRSGKTRSDTLSLVKERGRWKLSGIQ
jgi:Putative lumazine-binding